MKRVVAVLIVVGFIAYACSNGGGTSPSPLPETSTVIPAPAVRVVTQQPVVGPDGQKVASISLTGTVTVRPKSRVWTACVYNGAQVFQHSFIVRTGRTPFDPGELCGRVTVQIDVQEGSDCPQSGYGSFDGFKAGRIVELVLDPCTEPTPKPSPTPSPRPTPSPEPSPTPSPEPSPEPSPSPSPDPCGVNASNGDDDHGDDDHDDDHGDCEDDHDD